MQVGDTSQEASPYPQVIERYTHTTPSQWMAHVVGIAQHKHTWVTEEPRKQTLLTFEFRFILK